MTKEWKPAHRLGLTQVRGTIKPSCICGWLGPKRDTRAEAVKEYERHAGIMERLRI